MKFTSLIFVAAALAAGSSGAETLTNYFNIVNPALSQDALTRDVYVDYTLQSNGSEPAIVQLDILTNGVSIGVEKIQSLSGDVWTGGTNFVSPGAARKRIVWAAKKDWPHQLVTNAVARILYSHTNALRGVYMVIDLSKGTAATAVDPYPISYTLVPPDPARDSTCYSNKLWLRHVEKDTFTMGCPTNEVGNDSRFYDRSKLHTVKLTHSFFAGVFPVTVAQYRLVQGSTPNGMISVPATEDAAGGPVNAITFTMIRGGNAGTNWPASNAVDAGTFFYNLRQRTAATDGTFDLPTEAQWEFACRAGTSTALNTGYDLENATTDSHLALAGWYAANASSKVHRVGLMAPNAWGLYDFHGNVWDLCLDRQPANWNYPDSAEDPVGNTNSNMGYRIKRGGGYDTGAYFCRSGMKSIAQEKTGDPSLGFRVFWTEN